MKLGHGPLKLRRQATPVIVSALLFVPAGCTQGDGDESGAGTSADGNLITYPVGFNQTLDAPIADRISVGTDCVLFELATGEMVKAIWPAGTVVSGDGGTIILPDGTRLDDGIEVRATGGVVRGELEGSFVDMSSATTAALACGTPNMTLAISPSDPVTASP